eukprot:1538392-Alexandrium_andersonii.AAC.1
MDRAFWRLRSPVAQSMRFEARIGSAGGKTMHKRSMRWGTPGVQSCLHVDGARELREREGFGTQAKAQREIMGSWPDTS